MSGQLFISTDDTRTLFSQAMSGMYRKEVPQYGTLLELVKAVNEQVLSDSALNHHLSSTGQLNRLDVERHGAIRVGTSLELATLRRLFAVMGMFPVGYYDLTVASVPVHSTAFRPIDEAALAKNPFRVFTSLLRLELIDDPALRETARSTLAKRKIFTERCLELIALFEQQGGLDSMQAEEFVAEALFTFKWHHDATVDGHTYDLLRKAHPLIADVVCFKGPHINHLTPRTLDIDEAQASMPKYGITAKETIEGPPRRKCPILLRQTSFMALREPIFFTDQNDSSEGTHTARFGEIEQRGVALTSAGRALYDELTAAVREQMQGVAKDAYAQTYQATLNKVFERFPDSFDALRKQGLAFFYARPNDEVLAAKPVSAGLGWDELVEQGYVRFDPIIYEDFLPVSAAGIFQSNLGAENSEKDYKVVANRTMLEDALGAAVHDEIALYAALEQHARAQTEQALGLV
ncbi:DUF1338 family protein [Pollutimonas bauzanensis]|uniref:2-oxoadipate dioxygenase/decarboxylase HglS n=1 Tax=Pollutimonas bauzanensis TaxID=658167 RepID=UPI00333F9109